MFIFHQHVSLKIKFGRLTINLVEIADVPNNTVYRLIQKNT